MTREAMFVCGLTGELRDAGHLQFTWSERPGPDDDGTRPS